MRHGRFEWRQTSIAGRTVRMKTRPLSIMSPRMQRKCYSTRTSQMGLYNRVETAMMIYPLSSKRYSRNRIVQADTITIPPSKLVLASLPCSDIFSNGKQAWNTLQDSLSSHDMFAKHVRSELYALIFSWFDNESSDQRRGRKLFSALYRWTCDSMNMFKKKEPEEFMRRQGAI